MGPRVHAMTASPQPPIRQEKLEASLDVIEVAPGVLRMQLPIELPGLRHINTYVLADKTGVSLVDPGVPGPQSWADLMDRLGKAEVPLERVHTVFITHSHPDHFGNAMKIREHTGARIVTHSSFLTMHETNHVCVLDDCADPEHAHGDVGQVLPERGPVYGFDQPAPWGGLWSPQYSNPELRKSRTEMLIDKGWALPKPTVRVRSGEMVPIGNGNWKAVHTPGHTIDHLCLFDQENGTMITGDHILPTITPHISGIHGGADPLEDFFRSLKQAAALPGVKVGLPAHGGVIADVPTRAIDIIEHHIGRMGVLVDASAGEGWLDVAGYSRHLFRPERQGSMADSETYAHLAHLEVNGTAERRVRDDGSHEFKVSGLPESALPVRG
jgi:glyoxylase-like metal-dependent hydrolase (beta-lactamase superfamily II)